MSFRCEFCGEAQPPRTKAKKVPIEVRIIQLAPAQEEDPDTGFIKVHSRQRIETVKEALACPLCAGTNLKPNVVEIKEEAADSPRKARS